MTVDQKRTEWIDKTGVPLILYEGSVEDCTVLKEMYDTFSMKGMYQGLPPAEPEDRVKWISGLLRTAENFLARDGTKVVGHASLLVDREKNDAEFIIFVHSSHRNRGLGIRLTTMAIEKARKLGLKAVWLTVEAFNFRAVGVYRKCGFTFLDTAEQERHMRIEL